MGCVAKTNATVDKLHTIGNGPAWYCSGGVPKCLSVDPAYAKRRAWNALFVLIFHSGRHGSHEYIRDYESLPRDLQSDCNDLPDLGERLVRIYTACRGDGVDNNAYGAAK
jgi:hypothetical protein